MNSKNKCLINPKLLLSIPSFPDPAHIGGIIDIGPDNNLYVTVGNFQHTVPSEVITEPRLKIMMMVNLWMEGLEF